MRLFIFLFTLLTATTGRSQQAADLSKLQKSPEQAAEYRKDLVRMTQLLSIRFLARANKTGDRINRKIQTYFEKFRISPENEAHLYPESLSASNLTISVVDYDYTWGLPASSQGPDLFEGYRLKTLEAIVTIPVMETYRRGSALRSLSFLCKLKEEINWTETRDNQLEAEKLPSYRRKIDLRVKNLDWDE